MWQILVMSVLAGAGAVLWGRQRHTRGELANADARLWCLNEHIIPSLVADAQRLFAAQQSLLIERAGLLRENTRLAEQNERVLGYLLADDVEESEDSRLTVIQTLPAATGNGQHPAAYDVP